MMEMGDRSDNTPLHAAAAKGHVKATVALLEAGADPDNKNEDEQTPFHVAAKGGFAR